MTYVGKPIGLRNLTWFPLTADPETDTSSPNVGKVTYGTAQPLSRVIEATLSPQFAEALLESDDSVEDDIRLASSYEVTINASQLTDEIRAQLMGHIYDDDGGSLFKQTDTPEVGALAFRALLSKQSGEDDMYVHVVLYKGRFQEFEETFKSVEKGNITLQTHSGLRGTFVPRAADGAIMYRLRGDEVADETAAKAKITNWFTAPQEVGTVTDAT